MKNVMSGFLRKQEKYRKENEWWYKWI